MSLEEIIKECLYEFERPDKANVRKLSTENQIPGAQKTIQDLIFCIHYPVKYCSNNHPDHDFFYQNIEAQSKPLSEKILKSRAILYLAEIYAYENLWLHTKKAQDLYSKAFPVSSIWILYNPSKKDSNTLTYLSFLESNQVKNAKEKRSYQENSQFPMERAILVNVGKEDYFERQDIFGFYRTLIQGDLNKIIKMCEILKIPLSDEEKFTMNAYELFRDEGERVGFEKGLLKGQEEGLRQGREEGRIQAILEIIQLLLTSGHFDREQIQILKNSTITNSEITKIIDHFTKEDSE